MKVKIKNTYCNVCHVYNKETAVFPTLLWFKFRICQSCVSKLFQLFRKGK